MRFSKPDGQRLKLFLPTVALAPDGWSVVTVAPAHSIPSAWEMFQPAYKLDFLPLLTVQGVFVSDGTFGHPNAYRFKNPDKY